MIAKYLMLAFSTFALNNRMGGREPNKISDVKKIIYNEILSIGLKILMGIILASIIIFSLIQLGMVFEDFLNQYENGPAFILVGFGSIAIGSLIALFVIFRSKTTMGRSSSGLNIQSLTKNFIDGFMQGMEREKPLQ